MSTQREIFACSTAREGFSNVRGMKRLNVTHPSALRLLEAARALHPRDFTGTGPWSDLGRLINESDQTVNNWRSRGVPKTRVHGLCDKIGCRWQWVLHGDGLMCEAGKVSPPGVQPAVSMQAPESVNATESYDAEALGMAMRLIRDIEDRGRGRLPNDEFVRLTLAVADWVASLDRAMTEDDERRFADMLVKLVTGMLNPITGL